MVGMPGFWPGFLALDRRTGGGSGPGFLALDRRTGVCVEIQLYSTTETEKYSSAVLFLS